MDHKQQTRGGYRGNTDKGTLTSETAAVVDDSTQPIHGSRRIVALLLRQLDLGV